MWHKATAKIVYDPPRPRLKKKVDWWCVATTDNEICRYYRYWVMQNPQAYGESHIDLKSPSWGSHISCIRGEEPPGNLKYLWKRYDGRVVDIEYNHFVERSGSFWFVEVRCQELKKIREEFGFPTNWPLHLTIGRL